MKRISRQLDRWHSDEGGAVALMCLAAILILFMTVLIMFDASRATQNKIDVQMGADTAGYTAGATGARAMNMVAFANVGKRTAVGIHNMYVFGLPAYSHWIDIQCGCCCNCTFCTCPDFTCCFNCWFNRTFVFQIYEFIELIDLVLYALDNELFDSIEELDEYQLAVADIAKTWSAAEAQVRGIRNNANMMVVWPDPTNTDDEYLQLPLTEADNVSESCLMPAGMHNSTTSTTAVEFVVNHKVLADESMGAPPGASDGPADVLAFPLPTAHKAPPYLAASVLAAAACVQLDFFGAFPPTPSSFSLGDLAAAFAHMALPEEAAPRVLDIGDPDNPWDSGNDHLRTSYWTFAYKHTPQLGRRFRDNYQFLSGPRYDYQRNDDMVNTANRGAVGGHSETASFPETGMFAMARSEFYFPPGNEPNMGPAGDNRMWMHHPGWMGKLRPVMLPYEVDSASDWSLTMSDIVQESLPTGAALASSMFQISNVDHYDSGGFAADQQYLLLNVGPDMVGGQNFSDGFHHYLDGSPK